MPFTITKTFTFSAAHHLPEVSPGHPCGRPHGHNYKVWLVLEAPDRDVFYLPQRWVQDYGDLQVFDRFLQTRLDHQDLNEVLTFEETSLYGFTPTAEMLAYYLYTVADRLLGLPRRLVAVRVSETDKTTAEYRPDPLGEES